MTIFKVFKAEQWAAFQASGGFSGSPDDVRDGFIHLSSAEQLAGTLAKHFAGQAGLVIAEINASALGNALRWERSRDGALFPHFYGTLPISAVIGVRG